MDCRHIPDQETFNPETGMAQCVKCSEHIEVGTHTGELILPNDVVGWVEFEHELKRIQVEPKKSVPSIVVWDSLSQCPHIVEEETMSYTGLICSVCGHPITGFVAHEDSQGPWCEDCTTAYTCDGCGNIAAEPVQIEGTGYCDVCREEEN